MDENNIRLKRVLAKAEQLKEITCGQCKICKGTREKTFNEERFIIVDCECMSKFRVQVDLLKSNVSDKYLDIFSMEFFERKVIEYDLIEKKPVGKAYNFGKLFAKKFVDKSNYIMENSLSSLFLGNNESGKTFGANYILANYIKKGYSGHYLRFKQYMNMINEGYTIPEEKLMLKIIKNVDILVLDELGKENGNPDYICGELEELIKFREEKKSVTILITNLDIEDFTSRYKDHISNALIKNYKILVFHPDGEFRKKTRAKWPM